MTEYIDRNILFEQIRLTANRSCLGETSVAEISAMEIVNVIANMPVADVEPVKHGHWIATEYYNPSEFGEEEAYTFKCSECGNAYHSAMGMSYCMDCGAKMDNSEVKSNER